MSSARNRSHFCTFGPLSAFWNPRPRSNHYTSQANVTEMNTSADVWRARERRVVRLTWWVEMLAQKIAWFYRFINICTDHNWLVCWCIERIEFNIFSSHMFNRLTIWVQAYFSNYLNHQVYFSHYLNSLFCKTVDGNLLAHFLLCNLLLEFRWNSFKKRQSADMPTLGARWIYMVFLYLTEYPHQLCC